jgi:hypothetical protein
LRPPSERPSLFLFFGGAGVILLLSISRLPSPRDLLHAPATPFDLSAPSRVPSYRLLSEAASVIPPGVSVSPISEPRDHVKETSLHREAVGLLPGRKVLPAAIWDVPTNSEDRAEFLIVAGQRPSPPPGELLLETPRGTVWRRRRS